MMNNFRILQISIFLKDNKEKETKSFYKNYRVCCMFSSFKYNIISNKFN